MNNQQSITAVIIGVFVITTSLGALAGCADRDRASDMDTNGDTSSQMSEKPQTQNQDYRMAQEQEQTFRASLEGSNEVPEVDTEASGSTTVTLRGDSIHLKGEFSGLGSEYTGSHIHLGAEGENGDPIQSLEPSLGDDKMSGTWDNTYPLSMDHISALKADSLYINVHSAENKAGEIRGQLTSSEMDTSGMDM
ncbi:CHRD domain-containing protein [Fodinibius sediminis]|uniref:CHRD domain-containing protein n=1 Tax=Fodinibius sediminis TaxID=1214077 RepID=A0A521DAV8_9BACT|nr:CHRD domain-containing protein [Fodinibius sediminis]SMO68211.1 CHRD domain-containing protein [Fodinibius sediminis]